jgi:hypothetical protein
MHKLTSASISTLFRCFLFGLGILAWFIGLVEPASLLRVISANREGNILLFLLALCSVIGMFDLAVNDLHSGPDRFRLTKVNRQYGLSFIAFLYSVLSAYSITFTNFSGLTLYFLWNVLAIMAFVFIDAYQRGKDGLKCNSAIK